MGSFVRTNHETNKGNFLSKLPKDFTKSTGWTTADGVVLFFKLFFLKKKDIVFTSVCVSNQTAVVYVFYGPPLLFLLLLSTISGPHGPSSSTSSPPCREKGCCYYYYSPKVCLSFRFSSEKIIFLFRHLSKTIAWRPKKKDGRSIFFFWETHQATITSPTSKLQAHSYLMLLMTFRRLHPMGSPFTHAERAWSKALIQHQQ